MNKTIEYYNNKADSYVEDTMNLDMGDIRRRFLSYLPANAKILDAGCGSGRDTIAFLKAGYDVDAMDASQTMCEIASKNTGVDVQCISFEELTGDSAYDGIWACASLLHVKRSDLENVLDRLHSLLKTDGVLYASFKYGENEKVKGDRYFNDMTENLIQQCFSNIFTIVEIFSNNDHRDKRSEEKWINVIARK